MSPALLLDDEATWPSELKKILDEGMPILRAFFEAEAFKEEARVKRLQRDAVMMPENPPPNPHQMRKDEIFEAAGRSLAGLSVIGWHCTRLCDDEIEKLRRDGLYPLSPGTFATRLEQRIRAGDIPRAAAKRFANEHKAKDNNRQMLWFIFTRSLLQDEDGVGRLFTSWGGEALYVCHERDDDTGPILRSIGKPSIIEAEIPIELIQAYWSPAEWITRPYLHRRGVNDGHSPEREGHTRETIGPERIRRVITIDDGDFDALTNSSGWTKYPVRGEGGSADAALQR